MIADSVLKEFWNEYVALGEGLKVKDEMYIIFAKETIASLVEEQYLRETVTGGLVVSGKYYIWAAKQGLLK